VSGAPALAVVVGAGLGLGLWLIAASLPRLGRPRLMQRVAPYLADVSDAARASLIRRTTDPAPVLGVVAIPLVRRGRALLAQLLGGDELVRLRLRQCGSAVDPDRFRGEQLAWAVTACCVAAIAVLMAPSAQSLPLLVRVMVPVLAAALGAALRDWLLQRAAATRAHQRRTPDGPRTAHPEPDRGGRHLRCAPPHRPCRQWRALWRTGRGDGDGRHWHPAARRAARAP
jgi:tight adherence protein C